MKRWMRRIGVGLGGVLVALLVYGALIEPRLILDIERGDVPLPGLSEDLAGTEVAVISDVQLGMWFANHGMVKRAVETTVAEKPDVVLLGGDFLYSTDPTVQTQIDTLLRLLDPLLGSGIPTFAVLGNHDHAVEAADELHAALQDAGVTVLRNAAAPVPSAPEGPAHPLFIVGVGPDLPGLADVDAALADVPDAAPRVVLMHNPTVFDELPAGSAPLTLAGHTHCGQVVLPGTPDWSYLALTSEEKIVADGWAPDGYGAAGNRLFVTCGVGFSVAPLRINAPPQVAFFTLRPGGRGRGELLRSEDRRVHGTVHRGLDPRAPLVDSVHVGLTRNHDVDVVRCRTGVPQHPRCEGAVEERRLEAVDASKLLGQDHHRTGRDHEDLAQGIDQRTLSVCADQPRAANLSLPQDAGVHQAGDLAVRGGAGQAGPSGQIGDASSSPVSNTVESSRA